ncbi:electron transport complex subunit RsxC [uncultured Rikenella sp.]|uniref:electron transport complex subunit RsxC n=1 Tax=uncultured Rikenella sp. TaxID=368003 RepID=UPI00262E41B9|nr:electron transport complex subunit RsxC [uncultured Rikenella sp.]
MLKTFRLGGVHPHDYKISRDAAIRMFDIPATVTIPLGQHIGAPATAAVKKGDRVLVGDVIGTATGFVSANIHSSVSGTVTSVDAVPDGANLRKPAVTIAVEGDEWNPAIDRSETLVRECTLEPKEIIAKIAAAGIVGLGGATFPTQVKLSVPPGKKAEMLIINGVECEPYLTADYRLMMERGEELLVGCEILMRALGVEKCYIGIENNKPEAIGHLRQLIAADTAFASRIEVVPLKMRYPQGGEKQLIAAIAKREVPSGALPIDVGAVVQNVGTTFAVYQAVQKNRPIVDRVVTVTGKKLANPSNLLVRIGTPISSLIEACGGMPEDTGKVINGGPMMGRAMANIDAPVTKGTSGVLLMDERSSLRASEMPCISCAKCVDACPMGLEPYLISKLSRLRLYDRLERERTADCIECGCCSFTCPSHLPLLDYIRLGKAETMKLIRARQAK